MGDEHPVLDSGGNHHGSSYEEITQHRARFEVVLWQWHSQLAFSCVALFLTLPACLIPWVLIHSWTRLGNLLGVTLCFSLSPADHLLAGVPTRFLWRRILGLSPAQGV